MTPKINYADLYDYLCEEIANIAKPNKFHHGIWHINVWQERVVRNTLAII